MAAASSTTSSVTRQSVLDDAERAAARAMAMTQRPPATASLRETARQDAAYAAEHEEGREALRHRLYSLFAEEVDDMRRSAEQLADRMARLKSGSQASTASYASSAAPAGEDAAPAHAASGEWPPLFPTARRATEPGTTLPRGEPADVISEASRRDTPPNSPRTARRAPAASHLEHLPHVASEAAECGHHPYDREVAKLAASQRKRAAQLLHQLQAAHRAQEAASVREGALIQELAVAFTKAFGTTVLSSARSAALPATAAPQRARSASRRGEAARDEIPSRPASGGPVSRRNAATPGQRRENAAARRPPSPTVNVQSFLYRNCARHAAVQPKVDTWRRRSPTVKAHTDIAHMNRSHSGGPPRPTSGEGVRTLAHQHPATFFQEGARRAVHFVPATAGAAGSLWARN
jgi:hypothetical protein